MEHTGILMEITEQTLIDIIKGQATVAQTVTDLKGSFEKVIPYLVERDEHLAKDIRGVERKIWYFGGAGSILGFIGTNFIGKYFGGK